MGKQKPQSDTSEQKTSQSPNVRVYELAKRFDLSSKELIEILVGLGVPIKNHMSTLDPETIILVEAELHPEETPASEKQELQTDTVESKAEVKDETQDIETVEIQPEKNVEKIEVPDDSKKDELETVPDDVNPEKSVLQVTEGVTVGKLASQLNLQPNQLIMQLMKLKVMASINQSLDPDTLSALSKEYGFEVIKEKTLEEELLTMDEDAPESLVPRAPVVTIMGHVDHGKTSLLDSIRESNISESEAGNITQHIGAYHVELENGSIVFLDTPGHAAFTAMRARGAQVTDLVVLIVAADDGVMPQTIEAINHAKAAKVPIVVAINKIDVPGARSDFVKQQLVDNELVPEDWGGQTICVEVSAIEGTGIELLLEMILLEAALLELKANPNKPARGVVIEAQVDKGRGAVATVLVQSGTLRVGDTFVSGRYSGRVRAMMSDDGKRLKEAQPSTPVEVLGFTGVPEAGNLFYSVESEKDARTISEERQDKYRIAQLGTNSHVSLDDLYQQIQEGDIKDLNLIIKGDVQGSVQAITESLKKLSTQEVKINIIHEATGGITETDILLASASDAIVVGFNVHPTTEAVKATETEGIDVRTYTVIYDILSDIRSAMEGLLEPEVREVIIGRAEVREIFRVPRSGLVAGSYVNWGRISFNQPLRVLRQNRLVFEGKVDSLRRFKDNVTEVQANYECGIGIEEFDDIKIGDVLECYVHEEVARTL
ncbi:translation initiation factor IF-2 [Candidatus Poribacteria bacterium]|nr:translation initiation factor IF-2 [Candidatus Poribacteria bacterium]